MKVWIELVVGWVSIKILWIGPNIDGLSVNGLKNVADVGSESRGLIGALVIVMAPSFLTVIRNFINDRYQIYL